MITDSEKTGEGQFSLFQTNLEILLNLTNRL